MGNVRLDQTTREVVLSSEVAIAHEVVFQLFDGARACDYDAVLERALVLGAYALQLDEIGEMLDRASVDVQGRLMQLKVLFELRGLRERGAAKGDALEEDLADVLQRHADGRGWSDSISRVGGVVGSLPRRKVGDLLIELDSVPSTIVVEAKFDKSFALGDPSAPDRSASSEKSAHGQNYVALANRQSDFSIFVVDVGNCHKTVSDQGRLVFLPEQPGFVAVVDRARGDWSALNAAYGVARALCLAGVRGPEAWAPVDLAVKRLSRCVGELSSIDRSLMSIATSARAILDQTEGIRDRRESLRRDLEALQSSFDTWASNPVSAIERMRLYLGETVSP